MEPDCRGRSPTRTARQNHPHNSSVPYSKWCAAISGSAPQGYDGGQVDIVRATASRSRRRICTRRFVAVRSPWMCSAHHAISGPLTIAARASRHNADGDLSTGGDVMGLSDRPPGPSRPCEPRGRRRPDTQRLIPPSVSRRLRLRRQRTARESHCCTRTTSTAGSSPTVASDTPFAASWTGPSTAASSASITVPAPRHGHPVQFIDDDRHTQLQFHGGFGLPRRLYRVRRQGCSGLGGVQSTAPSLIASVSHRRRSSESSGMRDR
ncbi:hypothetical protein T45_06905 [Streptomyces turgidiscabies]|nr:hypothetical protein T45_06905 [Streptomyces turgidiscabies]